MSVLRGIDIGSGAKSLLRAIWQDLRAKRLWPVAVGLVLAMVAVPVLLSRSASPAAAPPAPVLPPPPPGMPAVTQRLVPASVLHASPRDPFKPQAGSGGSSNSSGTPSSVGSVTGGSGAPSPSAVVAPSGSVTPAGGVTTTPAGGGSGSTSSDGGSTGSSSGSSGTSGDGSSGSPGPTTPLLGPRQSYEVKLAITNSSGGIDTLNPLERLSILPAAQEPLLVELGVLKGGGRVLFAVEPGARVSGPGMCIPGPIECQILSLSPNQTERLTGNLSPSVLFAVTGITVVTHSSVAGAQQARESESAAGRRLIDNSSLSALSLFRYDPSVGAVLDLRNLILRGT